MMTLLIRRTGEDNRYARVTIVMKGKGQNLLATGTLNLSPMRSNKVITEPTIHAISQCIKNRLALWGKVKQHGRIIMYIGNIPSNNQIRFNFMVVASKEGARFSLNGQIAAQEHLNLALARTIWRAAHVVGMDMDEADLYLDTYLQSCIELPENISYVLENRCPYWFYEEDDDADNKYTKHIVRLSTRQIGRSQFAMEISQGVWGEFTLSQLNTFVNSYLHNRKRGKWYMVSPEELYHITVGKVPNSSQVKVMHEFMKQNRKKDIVEKRAMQLIDNLLTRYPSSIKRGVFNRRYNSSGKSSPENKLALLIRGKMADWMLVDAQSKSGIQDVSTYILAYEKDFDIDKSAYRERMWGNKIGSDWIPEGCYWNGPICIDNMSSGASVGDQFAARAFMCMNDNTVLKLVTTIAPYLRNDMHNIGQTKIRVDWNELPNMSQEEVEKLCRV